MISTQWINGARKLEQVHFIRREVFINEQGVKEEDEMDDTDEDAIHLLVFEDDIPVATGRILISNNEFLLGRIAVLKPHRKKSFGDLVVRMLIRKSFEMGGEVQYLHAQTKVKGFYEKIGFVAYGEEFLEASIPHINMKHVGDIFGNC